MPIAAPLAFRRAALPLQQHLREQIPEARRVVHAAGREIEALEAAAPRRRRIGGLLARVVAGPALAIDQRLVGFEHLPEAGFRRPVARVDVRVEPPCQPPVGPLDVRVGCGGLHTEHDVKVHYFFSSSTTSASMTSPASAVPGALPPVSPPDGSLAGAPPPAPACLYSDSATLCCACVSASIPLVMPATSFASIALFNVAMAPSIVALSELPSLSPVSLTIRSAA